MLRTIRRSSAQASDRSLWVSLGPDSTGLTILEVLVALSIIAIAFLALAMSQITNLKATVRTQSVTDLKAAANVVLEERMAEVLKATTVSSSDSYDVEDVYMGTSGTETRYLKFWFVDYYYSCPTVVTYSERSLRAVDCDGVQEYDAAIDVSWDMIGRSGVDGEGLLDIIVTATHESGSGLTIGDVITCYEVYPSPSSEVPMPCPDPTATGGGR